MPHILVVCTANICRSPVGEALLHQRLQQAGLTDWIVSSAGTWGMVGRSASPHSVQVCAERGLDIAAHSARIVDEALLAQADLALCMEADHVEALQVEFPAYANRIYRLTAMVDTAYDVDDPYGRSLEAYQTMANELESIIDKGLEQIVALAQANSQEKETLPTFNEL